VERGVPLEAISDDEEDPYIDEEDQEDIDLDADSEDGDEEEIMPPKRTPNKPATGRKNSAVNDDSTTEDISSRLFEMNIGGIPLWSMDFSLPYILSVYNADLDQMVRVDVFVPTLPREFFIPDIMAGGQKMQVKIQVPPFFPDERRVIQSNEGVDGFNHNTHQAQSFKDQCERIVSAHGMMAIYGRPMEISMPFVCEERLVEWEIQAYVNDLGTLTDDLGGEQFHAVLSIVARKLRTKRKTEGRFRVVGGGSMA
jgi:hypothetical protein